MLILWFLYFFILLCLIYRYFIILLLIAIFPQERLLVVFHLSLRDSKSLLVSGVLLCTPSDLKSYVVWILLILPLISISSTLFPILWGLLELVSSSASFSIVFCFFFPQAKSKYLSSFSFSLIFTLWFARTVKFTGWQVRFLRLN